MTICKYPSRAVVILMLGGLLVACHASAATAADAAHAARAAGPAAGATVASPAVAASATVNTGSQDVARKALAGSAPARPQGMPAAWVKHLRKGRSYAAFRKQALANGWTPVTGGQCGAATGSCHGMPELHGCSADGYCEMQLAHPGAGWTMQVDTYGPVAGWQRANSDLRVIGWHFVRKAAK